MKWVYETFGKPHRRRFEGGVDVVVNFTGGDTWVPSLKVLHRQGTLLTCGATAGFDPKEDIRYIWTFELRVLGSNGWMREDLSTLIDLIRADRLRPVIDREFALDDVNEAFRILEAARSSQVLRARDRNGAAALRGGHPGALRRLGVHALPRPPRRARRSRARGLTVHADAPEIERGAGTAQFHGGPIAAFIDCVGDFAVALIVGGGVPTINIRIDYLTPAVGTSVVGPARVAPLGPTVTVVDVDVYDRANALVAVGRGTYCEPLY